MKFKIFTLLIILGIMSITPMIYMGKFDPMAFISDLSFSGLDSIEVKSITKLTDTVSDEKVQVYRWRDENGVMQFSNTPPAGSTAEQIVLDTNSNVVQAVKVPVKEEKTEDKPAPAIEPPSPYSVKGMKKVMDDARGVEDMLQKRHEEQQKMLNNI